MASSSFTTIFLLLLSAFLSTPSHADLITVQGVRVTGQLVCSATLSLLANCLASKGIPGVDVTVTFTGSTSPKVVSTTTDSNGLFNADLHFPNGLLFDTSSSPGLVNAQLQILPFPLTRILTAPLDFLGLEFTDGSATANLRASGLFV